MNKYYLSTIILLLLTAATSCKSSSKIANQKEANDTKLPTITQDDLLDIALLDSTSTNVTIPYGRGEIIQFDFPEHWYCGGGYLESSLKTEGLDNLDSIKYTKAYFSIIDFQRFDYNLILQKIVLSDSIIKRIKTEYSNVGDVLYQFSLPEKIYCYSHLRLPDYNGFRMYGIAIHSSLVDINPLYLVADKNGNIIDALATYEYSPPHVLEIKTCYIDDSYTFHVKHFTNVDGYEVNSYQPYERYRVSENGKFERCD